MIMLKRSANKLIYISNFYSFFSNFCFMFIINNKNILMKNFLLTFLLLPFLSFSQNCDNYYLNLNDSLGDGWNGNYLSIIDSSGTIIYTTTLDSGFLVWTLYAFWMVAIQFLVMVVVVSLKLIGV